VVCLVVVVDVDVLLVGVVPGCMCSSNSGMFSSGSGSRPFSVC
jgi:hypothetical protein